MPHFFVPAPFGTKANELVQFYYIDIDLTRTGEKYVLMVHNNHSGYSWLYPASITDYKTAGNALVDQSAAFGSPRQLMSDRPPNFKNDTLGLLCKELRSLQHFTLPYCTWSNSAVACLRKELLRIARAVLSKRNMRHNDWSHLVTLFQLTINNSSSAQSKNLAPITVFTGRLPSIPVATFLRSADFQPVPFTETQLELALKISKFVTHMDDLHPVVHKHTQSDSKWTQKSR